MKKTLSLIMASSVAVVLGLAVSRAQVDPIEDHYKCYRDADRTQPKFARLTVHLADQFGSANDAVLKPLRYCNPVDKNGEGIDDPTGHLGCYKLKGRVVKRNVKMTNQFGEQLLTTTKTDQLCVPSAKNGVPLSSTAGAFLNHFQCYKVRRAPGAPHFAPVTVTLEDQFETRTVRLVRSDMMCNPVDKNGEGIPEPDGHLTCFRIHDASAATKRTITAEDQFGVRTLQTGRSTVLCVPSEKTLLP